MAEFKPHGTRLVSLPLADLKSEDLLSALDLWRSWCGGRDAPVWADVNLSAFPPKLLPMATVVDVIDGGKDFKYRYWGSELSRLFKREETGVLLSEHVVNQSGHIRFSQFWEVVVQVRPLLFMTIFERVEGVMAEKLNLRLPVIDDAGAVDKIISLSVLDRVGIQDFEDLSEHWQAEIAG
ncbi:MAG: hypothetical protein RLO05_10345 [Rhodospirillales bacterium]|tara:strand:+ start:794 stop:1333 length:540 start_codon:yes stop_codon:yes gene_type:complete